jgi:hypothetical protein
LTGQMSYQALSERRPDSAWSEATRRRHWKI